MRPEFASSTPDPTQSTFDEFSPGLLPNQPDSHAIAQADVLAQRTPTLGSSRNETRRPIACSWRVDPGPIRETKKGTKTPFHQVAKALCASDYFRIVAPPCLRV